jgi:hypothetical protein
MALIICYKCSKEISDRFKNCPRCGAPKIAGKVEEKRNLKRYSHKNIKNIRLILHFLSYLTAPSFIFAVYYIFKMYSFSTLSPHYCNVSLTFLGIGFSFYSLKDSSRYNTSHLSKKQIEGFLRVFNITAYLYVFLTICFFCFGIYILFLSEEVVFQGNSWKELGFGFLFLGIGLFEMTKTTANIIQFYNDALESD